MRRLHLPHRLVGPVAALGILACGGEDLTLPTEGGQSPPPSSAPGRIQIIQGNNQVGTAGSTLTLPVVVQLLDQAGSALANQSVTWEVGSGGGSATPQTSVTHSDGKASAIWTLGSPGPNTLRAVVPGLDPVTFTAVADSGNGGAGGGGGGGGGGIGTGTVPSASASTLSADPASIQVGTGLSTIRVTVRDAAGLPVPGAVVTLSATGSGNTLVQPAGPTGADGVAIGTISSTVAGTKDVMAIVNGAVQITQTAQVFVAAAPATRIEMVDGNNQSVRAGEEVPVLPAVRVTNALGQPVSGIGVTFVVTSGGGTVSGASQTTNAEGIARVGGWTLGSAGRNTLEARAGSLSGSPVLFEATATSPPPPAMGEPHHFVFTVPPRDVKKDEWFTVEVTIMDEDGNVVPLDGTEIYLGLWPEGSDVPANTRLAGDRFEDTENGVAVFNLYIKEEGRYRFSARSDYLPEHLGPYGPELFSNAFEVD